jgi:hypothetical protein
MMVRIMMGGGESLLFTPETTPIMVILSEADKENIAAHGAKGAMKYCAVPDTMTKRQLKSFMKIDLKRGPKP